jgi:hypothetical protein
MRTALLAAEYISSRIKSMNLSKNAVTMSFSLMAATPLKQRSVNLKMLLFLM